MRVLYVRRAYRNGRVKHPKAEASMRAVPLQAVVLDALDQLASRPKARRRQIKQRKHLLSRE